MSTTSQPSFVELWKEYLRAFNAHSLTGIKACLSPKVQVWVRGKLADDQWEDMKKNYEDHWALPNCVVTIESIEECEDGVYTKLVDHARGKLLNVKYVYALEDGQWLHIRHEIGEVVDWTGAEAKASE